jgi:ABC-type transport system involved in multi-copper enzyme maturation permease subunit
VTEVWVIAGYGIREAVRRRVFLVVLVLTVLFLALFWLANHFVFRTVDTIVPPEGVSPRTFAGAFMLGLGMFGVLFLGVVLGVFLTLGVVRGDAERGLLQPLVVRPVGRSTLLFARWLGAAVVSGVYVLGIYFAVMLITGATGHWWPGRIVSPGLELAVGVAIVCALSLLGSIFLSPTANGIAIFMLFGAGLVAGLLDTIGHLLESHRLLQGAKAISWAIPFEALYQDALHLITVGTSFFVAGFALRLGPFGGTESGGMALRLWALAYLVAVAAVAALSFSRRDL